MKKTSTMLAVVGLAIAAGAAHAQAPLTTTRVVSGLVRPIGVFHAPGDYSRIFIIEKQGRIRILKNGVLLTTPFLDIDSIVTGGTSVSSEQGLLGLAFHPDYATNGKFYVNYTAVAGSGDTVVAEYTVSANPDIANTTGTTLLTFDQPQTNHNGGWIAFGPDRLLYIAAGDGGNSNDTGTGHTTATGNAQDITDNLLGKMLRIDVDRDDFPADPNKNYGIPPTNPFVGITGDDEIWAYGLRNPWRDCFDRVTGDLYIADVGQGAWEEINFQAAGTGAGRNYGWRCMEGFSCTGLTGCTCNDTALTLPIHSYSHAEGCSITGGEVYRGCAIPDLDGTYFFADYCDATIWSFRVVGGSVTEFTDRTAELAPGGGLDLASITSFGADAYGEIYICDQNGGEVFKIVSAAGPANDCNGNGKEDACDILDGTSLDLNHNGIPDECGCPADFNHDGFVNGDDYDAFASLFDIADPGADLNNDGFVNGDDYDFFASHFDVGC
ncbi:MAG: PQQ-dependent sugar dehydrogenase [Phycisphaerales bacterium]